MAHDLSKNKSEDLDTISASSDQDMNYSSAVVPRPIFHHLEKAEMSPVFRHGPSIFAPLPVVMRRPVVPVEFSAGEPRGSVRATVLRGLVVLTLFSAGEPRGSVRGTILRGLVVLTLFSAGEPRGWVRATILQCLVVLTLFSAGEPRGWVRATILRGLVVLTLFSAGEPRGWVRGTIPECRDMFPAVAHAEGAVAQRRYSDFTISAILGLTQETKHDNVDHGQSTSPAMTNSYETTSFPGLHNTAL